MSIERKELIYKLREEGKTIPQICNIIKVGKGTVGHYLKEYDGKNKSKWIRSDQEFDLLKLTEGENIISLYKEISIKNIAIKYNVSQFFITKFLKEKGLYISKNRKLDIKNLIEGNLIYNNPYNGSINGTIKKYLIENKIFEYKCSCCGLDKWLEKYIILDLDHIDGNRNNNLLNNLRLLCPNCHSQTETYKGKKNKR